MGRELATKLGLSDRIILVLGRFSDPENCPMAHRAFTSRGGPTILEGDLLGVGNISVVPALKAIGLHSFLQKSSRRKN